jgi:hypothetical protein
VTRSEYGDGVSDCHRAGLCSDLLVVCLRVWMSDTVSTAALVSRGLKRDGDGLDAALVSAAELG